jgi:hypothetical protein
MKYMEKGGFQTHPLMRLTLLWTVAFLTGLWVTNFLFYFSKMGLAPQSVVNYYNGSETLFTQPRSFEAMLEVTHFHLPMMAIVILLLTHLLIFAPWPNGLKVGFISLTFGSALLEEGSGWLVRFVHPGFAILKIVSFLLFQALMAFLLLALALFLIDSASEKEKSSPRKMSR